MYSLKYRVRQRYDAYTLHLYGCGHTPSWIPWTWTLLVFGDRVSLFYTLSNQLIILIYLSISSRVIFYFCFDCNTSDILYPESKIASAAHLLPHASNLIPLASTVLERWGYAPDTSVSCVRQVPSSLWHVSACYLARGGIYIRQHCFVVLRSQVCKSLECNTTTTLFHRQNLLLFYIDIYFIPWPIYTNT